MSCDEKETKVGKRSWVSLEVLILAVLTTITIITTNLKMVEGIDRNAHDIAQLAVGFDTNTQELKKINSILTEMLKTQEVKNAVDIYKLRDRWSASCMSEHDEAWLKILQEFPPSLHHDDVPDLKEIQRKYGFGND